MTEDETIDLLTVAAAFDRRTTGDADVDAWHAAIGDLPFPDARDAVIAHYAESTEWIMPAHIRQHVRSVRGLRLARTPIPPPPPELLDHPAAYSAALTAARDVIATGGTGEDAAQAMTAVAAQVRRELEPETP